MPAKAVLQPELHAVEHELRRVAEIVVPHDQRIANDDLALAQDPVRDRQFFRRLRRVELEAGDAQHARAVAPYREPRPLDDELLQPQLLSGTDVQETIISSFGKTRSGVGLARTRSTTRKPSTTSFGFQPSQPVDSLAISTGWPSCRVRRVRDPVAVRLDLREHHEAHDEECDREQRKTDHDDGPDKTDQRGGDRARCAEDGARRRHNGDAPAL
jgi:hypothetical protein